MAGEVKTTRWGIVEPRTKIGLDSDKRRPRRICFSRSESKKQNLSSERRGKTESGKNNDPPDFPSFPSVTAARISSHSHFSSSASSRTFSSSASKSVPQRNSETKIGDIDTRDEFS